MSLIAYLVELLLQRGRLVDGDHIDAGDHDLANYTVVETEDALDHLALAFLQHAISALRGTIIVV